MGTWVKPENIESIEDTVFSIANSPEEGWFLAIGANRITDPVPTREECISVLEHPKEKWNIIMKMIIIVCEASLKVEREEMEGR